MRENCKASYCMFDLLFHEQNYDLCDSENAKHGREAQFENKKCENTLRIPLLLKNPIDFFSGRFSEIVKTPQGFPSKVDFRNVRNRKFIFGTLVGSKQRRGKMLIKPVCF